MNTTPEQLRLAADIIEKGLPWEYQLGETWITPTSFDAFDALKSYCEIRLRPASFPPLPDGMTWHLHSDLTPDILGPNHRPFVKGEKANQPHEVYLLGSKRWTSAMAADFPIDLFPAAYRVPLQTPYPDGSKIVDGKLVKPWTLTREIPGFRPLQDGEEWHRTDWTEDMLPEGWRPLLLGSLDKGDYEVSIDGGKTWKAGEYQDAVVLDDSPNFFRTRRPLPEPKKRVPLGASDVPPGSVFRSRIWAQGVWIQPVLVTAHHVAWLRYALSQRIEKEVLRFAELMEEWQILRPGQTEWQPCYREE